MDNPTITVIHVVVLHAERVHHAPPPAAHVVVLSECRLVCALHTLLSAAPMQSSEPTTTADVATNDRIRTQGVSCQALGAVVFLATTTPRRGSSWTVRLDGTAGDKTQDQPLPPSRKNDVVGRHRLPAILGVVRSDAECDDGHRGRMPHD
jgi:hypothetical protein